MGCGTLADKHFLLDRRCWEGAAMDLVLLVAFPLAVTIVRARGLSGLPRPLGRAGRAPVDAVFFYSRLVLPVLPLFRLPLSAVLLVVLFWRRCFAIGSLVDCVCLWSARGDTPSIHVRRSHRQRPYVDTNCCHCFVFLVMQAAISQSCPCHSTNRIESHKWHVWSTAQASQVLDDVHADLVGAKSIDSVGTRE